MAAEQQAWEATDDSAAEARLRAARRAGGCVRAARRAANLAATRRAP
jgi:hypothetical protein